MKSMSMVDHGSSWLNCVCRCKRGLFNDRRPAIHIRAGEKVCIHVIRPIQFFVLFASRHKSWMDSLVVSTGLATIFTGTSGDDDNPRTIVVACSSTFFSVSGP